MALLCAASRLFAQNTISDDLLRADKQFNLYAYNLALKTYKDVLKKDANNGRALARIADCYFQLNQPEESLSWYARAVEQREPNSDVQLRYGKALMYRGDYPLARRQFLEYAALSDEAQKIGRHYADMCDYAAKTIGKDPAFTAKNEALNTEASDFGPTFLNNRVIYSSARTDLVRKSQSKNASDYSGSAYNQLFVTQRNPENGSLQKPAFFRSDLQNNYNEGPVSFSSDGKKVAFCRNTFINGARQVADKGLNMSLYIADVVDGEWVNVKPFPFNGTDFATGFPCLTANGSTLLFASNNPNSTTGGKGWDIYVSSLVNGEWSTPRNLGAPLNTPGNEVTPFYDGADLYFSSDWHDGLGGLDVFRAELGKNEVKNVYTLGPGINSSYDDYGYVFNTQQKVGYLTSNRTGGRGNEDIWQIVKKAGDVPSSRSLSDAMAGRTTSAPAPGQYSTDASPVQYGMDESTVKYYYLYVGDDWGRPLQGVYVDMTECNGEKGQTDSEGKYYFTPPVRPLNCSIELSKEGYETTRVAVTEFSARNFTVSIPLNKRQEFTGTVLDARTNLPLSGAVVEFKDDGKPIQTMTDYYGKYALMMTPRNTYDVEFSKEGYKVQKVKIRPGMAGTGTEIAPMLLEPGAISVADSRSFTTAPVSTPPANTTTLIPNPYTTPTTYVTPTYTTPTYTTYAPSTTTLVPVQHTAPEPEHSGYAIQLSAMPENLNESNSKKFESLAKYGNIYTKAEDNKYKVRLGIFPTKEEAQKKLKEVNKDSRFKGAFIVDEWGADKDLLLGRQANTTAPPAQYGITTTTTTKAPPVRNDEVRYAVQVGSFSPDNKTISISDYASLSGLGNVYSKLENGSLKMRLGVWPNYADAESAQSEVVKRGFKDAIVVTEKTRDESIKGFMLNGAANASSAPATYSTRTPSNITPIKSVTTSETDAKYYVRVCAMKDASKFDATQLEAAGVDGRVEKWPVGNSGITAIMLAGYSNLDAAARDKERLRFSGFPDAYIVKELKGEVSRVK